MNTEPTDRVTFDADALTERQLDGLACVACGTVFAAGSRSVPAGEALGAQVFACVACAVPCPDCGTVQYEYRPGGNDRARLDCEQDHPFPTAEPVTWPTATVPGTWPGGEPADVREAEDFERKLIRIVQRIEREHGPDASRTMLRVLVTVTDDPPKLSEEEGADLLRLVGAGNWESAAARLDEIGTDR